MAVVTYAVFKELVGRKLGILAIGGSLSAEDADVITDAAESLRDEIEQMGLETFDFTSGVDTLYAGVLADMTAAELVDHYGVPEPRASRMRAEGLFGLSPPSSAERRLKRLIEGEMPSMATVTDFTIGR